MEDGQAGQARWRALAYRGDPAALVVALTDEPLPGDALQLLGPGVVAAVSAGVEGAAQVAARLGEALAQRGWPGDPELRDAVMAVLGVGPPSPLLPVPVDLEDLSSILEGDPLIGGGRVDLWTGDVWPSAVDDLAEDLADGEVDDDPERWLLVPCEGSQEGYRDLEWFIESLDDPDAADRLSIAIEGRGAFRRFKHTLRRWPDLEARYYRCSDERRRGRAREWLAAGGFSPVAPPRTPPASTG